MLPRAAHLNAGLLAGVWLLASCGRIGFDPAPPPDATPSGQTTLVLEAASGAGVPAGSSVEIALAVEPPVAPGTEFLVRASAGTLAGRSGAGAELRLAVEDDGTLQPIRLFVDIDAVPGATISLSSDAPRTTGTLDYQIQEPRLRATGAEGDAYDLVEGFHVSHVSLDGGGADTLAGGKGRILFPPGDSAFAPGPYLAMEGLPPAIYRHDPARAALELFSESPGDPDEGVAQIAFADPAGPHGDRLFVCSASAGDGDGVFTVDPAGVWTQWRDFNNCNGIAIDDELVLGDPGFAAPVYLDVNSESLERVHPNGMDAELLASDLPWGYSGIKLYINHQPPFPTGLYLVYPGYEPPDADGLVWYLPDATVADPAPKVLLDPLPGPESAVFGSGTRFGGLLYLVMGVAGEIHAVRPDSTSFVFMAGLQSPVDITLEPGGEAMWILEPAAAHILRVTAEPRSAP